MITKEKQVAIDNLIEQWKLSKGNGTIVAPTGFGKTYLGIEILKKVKDKEPDCPIVIVTKSAIAQSQWKKYIDSLHLNNIYLPTIEILSDWSKQGNINCKLVIVDEIQEMLTPDKIKALESINAKFKLALTATYDEIVITNYDGYNWLTYNYPEVARISKDECIDKGFISNFVEYNLGIPLIGREKTIYEDHSEYIKTILNRFNNNFDWLMYAASGRTVNGVYRTNVEIAKEIALLKGWRPDLPQDNQIDIDINKFYHPDRIIETAITFKRIIDERNKIINNYPLKLETMVALVEKFIDRKIICFSQSSIFADNLTEEVNKLHPGICSSYHSNLPSIPMTDESGEYIKYKSGDKAGQVKKFGLTTIKKNLQVMYHTGEISVISAVSALDSAFDEEKIGVAITSSGSENPIQYIQRSGRALRKKDDKWYEEFGTTYIINVYIIGTRDEEKLRKRQSTATHGIKWINNINEIC